MYITVAGSVLQTRGTYLTIGSQEAGRIFRALQTCRVLHISMNAQLTYEPIIL